MKTDIAIFIAKNPFVRLIIPFIAGIMIQWYFPLKLVIIFCVLCFSLLLLFILSRGSLFLQFKSNHIVGALLVLAVVSLGMLITFIKDIRNNSNWVGHESGTYSTILLKLHEKPIEKPNSFKAEASLLAIKKDDSLIGTKGAVIVYFKKDINNEALQAGSLIITNKLIQPIKNSNNPGSFNYKRYLLFNGITHQLYVTGKDFLILPNRNKEFKFLENIKNYVLLTLQGNITGKKELGLAEALLIGYKADLDKTLLESYTNTGVVHVIAISGMHLALIYWMISLLAKPLLKRRDTLWLYTFIVLFVLWTFSLVAGGAASIIRAAVMFSFMAVGKLFDRNASIYNTLAASAFCLLCYNPYWLWDVGFQLSYAAVLSIVVFYKPIHNLIYVKQKWIDKVWQLIAVTIAAQIFTTPLSIYYFHQFPVYFLITNLLAVPLSSLILISELVLIIFSPIAQVAAILGKITTFLIFALNSFIELVEQLPHALWNGLQINLFQTVCLFMAIGCYSIWFFYKKKSGIWLGFSFLILFLAVRTISFYKASQQKKLIVYHVPKLDAIDIITGRSYYFLGDDTLQKDGFLRNFHVKPSRVLHRVSPSSEIILQQNANVFYGKKILLIQQPIYVKGSDTSMLDADIVILSKNPKLYIKDLLQRVKPKQIVISGSNPVWKANYWKRDCDSLKIPIHDVSTDGAFVMNLP